MHNRFEAEDPCELEADASGLCSDVLSACRVVMCLLRYPLNIEVDRDLVRMEATRDKNERSVVAIIGTAVWNAPWFADRWLTVRRSLPVIGEVGDTIVKGRPN